MIKTEYIDLLTRVLNFDRHNKVFSSYERLLLHKEIQLQCESHTELATLSSMPSHVRKIIRHCNAINYQKLD